MSAVKLDRRGTVAIVTINNPARRNAMSNEVRMGLIETLGQLQDPDDECRVIVVTGAGGTFCSGGDLSTMEDMSAMDGRRRMRRGHQLARLMVNGEKPMIAAVEGYAFGAGMSLALLCDRIIASDKSAWCASFAKVGLMADMAMLWSLPQRVGIGRARRLLMLADAMKADEALASRLVDEVVPAGSVFDTAIEAAEALAKAAPLPNAMTRGAYARWPQPLDDMLDLEAFGQGMMFDSEDVGEGLAAFREKRPTAFQGR